MDALQRVVGARGRLKVFPLPTVVLFPGAMLPLHIFEPRYRQMVEDALATDGVFAMARPRRDATGEPTPLESIVSGGVIANHMREDDGRYNLVLHGAVRARIVKELPSGKLYREFEVEPLPDTSYQGPGTAELRHAVLALAAQLPSAASDWVAEVAQVKEGGALADLVATAVINVNDPRRRGKVLDELDVPRRLELVLDDVGGLLARLGAQAGSGGLKN